MIEDLPAEARGARPVTVPGIASATRWMSFGQLITQGSRVAVSILLARWMTPEAFGLVAIALTTIVLLEIVKDLGTGAAIIQRRTIDQVLLNSVFRLNILSGTLAAAVMVVGAPLIARLFGSPEAAPVIQTLSVVLFLGGFTHVHQAVMRRSLKFAGVAKVDLTGAIVTGAVSVALAVAGLEVWAIVWGNIAGVVAGTIVTFLVSDWRPTRGFSIASLRSIAGFSLHTAGNSLFMNLRQNIDKVLVARWLGAPALGVYTLGQRTVSYPVLSLTNVLMSVLFPAFARLQDDDAALRRGYLRATGAIAFVTFPLLIGTAVIAEPFVETVLGDAWEPLVPLLWLMAPAGAIQALLSAVVTLYSAKGRADWLLRWGVVSGLASIGAYALGLQWGLTGLAVAYLLVNVILLPFGLAIPLRLIHMRLRSLLRGLVPYTAMTIAMAIASGATVYGGRAAGWSSGLQLALGITAGMVVYAGLALWIRPAAVRDLLTVAGKKR